MSKKVFIISLITILLVAVIGYTTYFIMQNVQKSTPEETLKEFAYHIKNAEYEEMYALLSKESKSLSLPQSIQLELDFFNTIEEPSTNISKGSFSEIPNLFLSSIGITILPSSSTFLVIPVDFTISNPPFKVL